MRFPVITSWIRLYKTKVVNFDVSPHRRLTGEIIGEIISPVKKLVKFVSVISTHLRTFCIATMPYLTLMHLFVGVNRGSRPFLSNSNIFLSFPLPYLLVFPKNEQNHSKKFHQLK